MQINSIVNRYIFLSMIPPFVINLAFMTFIFLMTQILDITNFIVNYKVSVVVVLRMLIYTMPFFLSFIIPMSVMLAILLTFLRMSSDNEIIALKAGGVSIYGILPPVLLFCLVGSLLAAFMVIKGLPWGRMSFKKLAIEVAVTNFDIGIKERVFNDSFEGVMLYVNKIEMKQKKLIDIFIEDQRTEDIVSTVVAPEGKLFGDPEKLTAHLTLFNGTINQVNLKNRSVHAIKFDTYDMNLDLKKTVRAARGMPKDEEEMSLGELRQYLRETKTRNPQYYITLMEYYKKFSIPVACFALGLLAMPLGIQSKTAKRSFGIVLGLVFFLVYYLMLSAGWVFGETGAYPPIIGMWAPNVVMGGIGIYFLWRTAEERPVGIGQVVFLYQRIKVRLFKVSKI